MPDTSQENKSIALKIDGAAQDDLLLASFTGEEAISRLFHFRLELLSEKTRESISFSDIIGKSVSIRVNLPNDEKRYFNGMVNRFVEGGADDFNHYQMEVVPKLWLLTRHADCRIFQNKSVKDIILQVLNERNIAVKDQMVESYSTEEYCVQYRETEFNFLSRLMEKHGIFYFFEHAEDLHTMILGDSSSAHPDIPGPSLSYYVGGVDDDRVISSWQSEQVFHSGKYTLQDYNFTTPQADLKESVPTMFNVGGNRGCEIFDYPGEYLTSDNGALLAKVRVQEAEASHFVASGSGFCRVFNSGYKFELKDHPRDKMNGSYVLTEVTHMASAGGYGHGDASYTNHFTCIPATLDDQPTTFRPPRVTPRPFVQGPQSAIVVGKSGEEIWTDQYGRVKVQFYWDRQGQNDENSSCWVRVSHPWAGAGWGSIWMPRIGQEVIVTFEEGNPDRPLIIGRVYNAVQVVPYKLPDRQTVSTFRGNSSKGGGGNPNEIRFEDKANGEQLFLCAKKDLDVYVVNDSREHINANRSLIVEQDQKEKVNGKYSLTVQSGIEVADLAGIHLKAPKIVLEADTMVSLVVGGNFVTIDSSGVAVTGTMVMLNSGGSAGSGGTPAAPDKADDGAKFTKS